MSIRRVVVASVALFMLALGFGLLFNQIQRVAYELAFDASTGARLHIGSLQHQGSATVFRDVRLTAAGGDASFTSARITVTRGNGEEEVALLEPSGTLQLGRDTLHRLRSLRNAFPLIGSRAFTASVSGGSLTLTRAGTSASPFQLSGFNGTIAVKSRFPAVEGTAVISDAEQTYPLVFSGGHVHAVSVPVAPVWALLPASDLILDTGFLHRLDVSLIGGLQGSIGVRAAGGTYAGHPLHGMHGTLFLSADGIGTRNVTGSIDGLPLQLGGEIHDVRNWNAALRAGTPDTRALARIFAMIAPTPHLRWIHLESTAPGIAFGQYAMQLDNFPRVVQLVTIDPREKSVHFDTVLSGDHLVSSGERTTQMGARTHAVAGLNGDYFDIARTYQPQGMLMRSGRLMRGPADRQALIIDRNNNVHFAEFHLHGSVRIGNQTLPVTQYNDWPLGYVTIVTPDFGAALPPVPGVRFLALHYVRGDRYRVTAVSTERVPEPLRFGIALGPDVKDVVLPTAGEEIHLSYQIDPPVKNAVAAIGGGPLLLRNGVWFEDPHAPAPDERDVRWPVDALGVLPDRTLIMVAVDGRHPERSVGMTRPGFAKLLQSFGVTDAMALDSGGSVTLVARSPGDAEVSLHNVPSDDSAERYVSNGIFVYSSAPLGTLLQNRATASAGAGGSN